MIPTLHGLITLLIGFWVLRRGTPLSLLCIMLIMGIFESSAALVLPMLSSSSIPPPRLMLMFLVIALAPAIFKRVSLLREAAGANASMLVFTFYGLIGAFTLPFLFGGQIDVVPLRPAGLRHLLDAFPLTFSAQNVTTAFYLAGSGLAAIGAYIACRLADDVRPIASACAGIALAHAITGLMGALLIGTPWDTVVAFIRNGSYSQLSQETKSFVRIAGFLAEPSNFARFGVVWLIFSLELWLRRINPVWTGAGAVMLGGVLAISTSSTAYLGLGAYAAILALRFMTFPSYLKADRIVPLGIFALGGAVLALAILILSTDVADAFANMLADMTTEKASSESGRQRYFWAMQGVDAFRVSYGLGIGAGSFRSSSLIMAIVGSMGIIGTVTFVMTCATLFLPRRNTVTDDTRRAISEAAAWAAVVGLIPGMFSQGSPDPGMEFAALSGISLALRRPAIAPLAKAFVRRWGRTTATPDAPFKAPEVPEAVGWRRSAR